MKYIIEIKEFNCCADCPFYSCYHSTGNPTRYYCKLKNDMLNPKEQIASDCLLEKYKEK